MSDQSSHRPDEFYRWPASDLYAVTGRMPAPGPPEDLVVTRIGDDNVRLAWRCPDEHVRRFRLSYRALTDGVPVGSADELRLAHGDGRLERAAGRWLTTVTGLRPGTRYEFAVTAVNPAGSSTRSGEVAVRTTAAPETAPIRLVRHEVLDGCVVFEGRFPTSDIDFDGHVESLTFPSARPDEPRDQLVGHSLAIVKRGRSSRHYGHPSSVVLLRPGQTASPREMAAIFGSERPAYSRNNVVSFAAWLLGSQPAAGTESVTVELSVRPS